MLEIQKNNRELEIIVQECILNTVRDSIPVETILKAYMDETCEEDVIEEVKEEVKEEPRYTMQEIKEAWDACGWVISTSAWEAFQKNLTKINSPEYQEYLRLKAIYE